ncbi:hypothetical protein SAMN02800687_3136 [Curtobacterium sp. UNCCL20]|uniref:DUF6804 family protein n=1 Tax=Curtobacterium sp. UNCCL20 TaxID=1502773 RepID=UPI00088473F2|nr:DUF6804 family protein [Curtobacterium sp. UNCCL20]SDQ93038.1 hypothetical protein SAMN02800687_3136 [Curtobacterium sp. UNCCL20]
MAARKGRPPVGSSQHGVPAGPTVPSGPAPTAGRGKGDLPPYTRPALAPALLAAVVLLACVAIVDSSGFVFARWGVTVLSLIILVFAVRGRAWWAAVLMAAVAVCWNPLAVVPITGEVWAALQLVAAALFIVVGIVVKVPRETETTRASRP